MTQPSEDRILAHGRQLGTLLPPGRAWSQETGGPQATLLDGLGEEFAAVEARVSDLLREYDPQRALELLSEWEDALGLPDPCVGALGTLDERRGAIVARLVTLAGSNPTDLIQLAATLGYQVRVVEHRPFEVGRSRVGDTLTNHQKAFRVGSSRVGDRLSNLESWLYTVDIIAPSTTVRRFAVGRSVVGERLAAWNNNLLECTLSKVAPAHVLLRFLYELQTQIAAPLTATVTPLSFLLNAFFDPEAFDLIAHERVVLVNAISPLSGPLWNLDTTATTAIDLPPVFVTAEMLKNGGTLRFTISGQYVNDTGSTMDLELAFYNGDAAVTPFTTICVEGMTSATGSNGAFTLQVVIQVRQTGQAHGAWQMIANPKLVADGSTASGQAAAFVDQDTLRMFATIDWNSDTLIVCKLRKKTASLAAVRPFEISVVADVVRSGVSAR